MAKIETKIILGIDEVGRGPWAGPLVVGAVVLGTKTQNLEGLADSKQLTAKKRTTLAPLIYAGAAAATTGWVSSAELDRYGLSASLKFATRRAVKQILATKVEFSEIVIDGTVNFLENTPLADRVTTLKKADRLIREVSAASIIAKVARDDYMIQLAEQYPAYGFENHVGYGTAKHRTALLEHGVCPEHRQSFRPIREIIAQTARNPHEDISQNPMIAQKCCKNYNIPKQYPNQNQPLNTTAKGQYAESLVANHLKSLGHTVIAQNFKTKTYEIDLISVKNTEIYFTEVKYRENSHRGTALDQITLTKQRQMRYAAEKFLSTHPDYSSCQPLLAVAAVEGEPPSLKTWFALNT